MGVWGVFNLSMHVKKILSCVKYWVGLAAFNNEQWCTQGVTCCFTSFAWVSSTAWVMLKINLARFPGGWPSLDQFSSCLGNGGPYSFLANMHRISMNLFYFKWRWLYDWLPAGADWNKISGREISLSSRPSHTPTTNFETRQQYFFVWPSSSLHKKVSIPRLGPCKIINGYLLNFHFPF